MQHSYFNYIDTFLQLLTVPLNRFLLVPSYVRFPGGDFKSGRVEIYHKGDWKPVCRDGWTEKDSVVACKELGFVNFTAIAGIDSSVLLFLSGILEAIFINASILLVHHK